MVKQEQIIQERLQRLTEKMKDLGYHEHWARLTIEYVNELLRKGVLAVDRFVQRLERCTKGSDKREYWDVLIEGRFAIILARNNFSNIEIEYAEQGPDLNVRWNRKTVYFEVTRKRSFEDEWAEHLEDLSLPSNKTETILDKIKLKLKQLEPGKVNIIVFWSSTVAVLLTEINEAFEIIDKDPEQYKDLSGVLFTEDGGVETITLKQFWLFENDKASKPLGPRLAKKLESLHE